MYAVEENQAAFVLAAPSATALLNILVHSLTSSAVFRHGWFDFFKGDTLSLRRTSQNTVGGKSSQNQSYLTKNRMPCHPDSEAAHTYGAVF